MSRCIVVRQTLDFCDYYRHYGQYVQLAIWNRSVMSKTSKSKSISLTVIRIEYVGLCSRRHVQYCTLPLVKELSGYNYIRFYTMIFSAFIPQTAVWMLYEPKPNVLRSIPIKTNYHKIWTYSRTCFFLCLMEILSQDNF